jgi:diguanylate cyclase (GGDEF)-like protein
MSADRTTEPSLTVPSKEKRDRGTLTVITGFNAGQVFALDDAEHVLGRGAEADLWLEDAGVSRRHTRITRRQDGHYFIEDLGSTNGTFIGTTKIDTSELRGGDRVQLGPNLILRFAITDDAEEELQRRLYESSTRDALTRVFNRKYFMERLVAEVAHAHRHHVKLSVLMLDLDNFKRMNDTYGHLAGDMILRMVAANISRLIRVEDLAARYGGEEFVILARSTGKTDAVRLAERIRSSIEQLEIPGPTATDAAIKVTTSIGVATLVDTSPEPDSLLGLADARLYRAKGAGRNQVCSEG